MARLTSPDAATHRRGTSRRARLRRRWHQLAPPRPRKGSPVGGAHSAFAEVSRLVRHVALVA